MYELRASTLQKQVAHDVNVVTNEARIIFEIFGQEVKRWENPKGLIDVIAVIGPGIKALKRLPSANRAELLEVGFFRSRPYQPVLHGPCQRHKIFALSPDQYQLVAPLIWSEIAELAEKTVSGWKKRTFALPTPRYYYQQSSRRLRTSEKKKDQPKGVRFSFDERDEFFLRDMYWAEMFGNHHVLRRLKTLSGHIVRALATYPSNGRSLESFCKLAGAKAALNVIERSSLPLYLIIEAFSYLPNGQHYKHLYHLGEAIGWDFTETYASTLARSTLSGPTKARNRLGDIQLRFHHEKRGHYVFEVYPPLPEKVIPPPLAQPALSVEGEAEDPWSEDDFPF